MNLREDQRLPETGSIPLARSPSAPTVRHSGRAHVRGKIRRIWRPRFLELWDNGLVRYYEMEDSHGVVAKYTLAVYKSRILDVTTFRDMHVGLPTNSFGFLFEGQRLLHMEDTSATTCTTATAETVNVKEQRDFLCAVPTLEEAQMWVVALQWAANQRKAIRTHQIEPWWSEDSAATLLPISRHCSAPSTPVSEPENMLGVTIIENSINSMDDSTNSESIRSRKPSQQQLLTSPSSVDSTQGKATLVSTAFTPHNENTGSKQEQRLTAADKVIITQVTQYRVVRTGAFSFQAAFEIHALLVDQQRRHAEHWSLLRTIQDLQRLIQALSRLFGPMLVDQYLGGRRDALQRMNVTKKSTIQTVDAMLRSLVLHGGRQVVNAAVFKEFLGFTSKARTIPMRLRLMHSYDGQSVLQSRKENRIPLNPQTADQFVRDWLKQGRLTEQSKADEWASQWLCRGIDTSQIALWLGLPLATVICRNYVPSIQMRMDVLILSWFGAGYLGRTFFAPVVATNASIQTRRTRLVPSSQVEGSPGLSHVENTPTKRFDESDHRTVDSEDAEDDPLQESVMSHQHDGTLLSSPLPRYPDNDGTSCWSQPEANMFHVRGPTYLKDRIKQPSGPTPLTCRGVDVWMTDNPERNIARHPAMLGGALGKEDTFLVNFLLPFCNFVAYFSIPPKEKFPAKLYDVWTKFRQGDQQYRDARLKLLPVVSEGPWIVKAAVGPGKSPALLGKVIPLQYFFREPTCTQKGVYEVDVIITASSIAKGILSVVKGHTQSVSIAFAFIIEGTTEEELPETVLCSFQMHSLHLEECPELPGGLDDDEEERW